MTALRLESWHSTPVLRQVDVYDRLRRGEVDGRAVVVPNVEYRP